METVTKNESLPILSTMKQEMDESIVKVNKAESGIFSDNSSLSDKPSWEMLEGEVCDLLIFDPPIQCSSNVWSDPLSCDISSIFELTPPCKEGNRESTHLAAPKSHQPGQVHDHDDWWTNDSGNRKMLKVELDASLEDEYFKKEYNNSFGLEAFASPLDCSDLVPENTFPLNINPQFDLQVLLQYGTSCRGAFYNDQLSLRARDFSRVKSPKMLMTRTKVEISAIRPGNVTNNGAASSIRVDEGRLNLLETVVVHKSKEIKQMLVEIAVLGEQVAKDKWESRCLKRELGAMHCRQGCSICSLDSKLKHLEKICPDIHSNTVPVGAVMGVTTDILDSCCADSEWLITNESFIRFIEFLLWDTFREGVSTHLAGATPCLFPDTDKLLALIRKALGSYVYNDLHVFTKVNGDTIKLNVFNDKKDEKPAYLREHLIMFEMEVIVGVSLTPFTSEQRKWSGKADICVNSKKRVNFIGLDIGTLKMPLGVIDQESGKFEGVKHLPNDRPVAENCLLPLDRDVRTILG